MDDLISRQAAIRRLQDKGEEPLYQHTDEDWKCGLFMAEDIINDLPTAEPTLYGYQIEHLALIARVMEKEGVTPEKVAELLRDVGKISEMVVDVTQTIREAVRRIDDDPSHPFADGVMMKE